PYHPAVEQHIRFCTAPDGVRLAYATSGKGPALVRAPHWLTHLEFDWRSPVHRPWLEALNRDHVLVRFDPRGCGLSERDGADVSFPTAWHGAGARRGTAGLERLVAVGTAQCVPREPGNHLLLPSDPAFAASFTGLGEFLGGGLARAVPVGGELTGREREILELIAQGLANARISERLGIRPNALRNHITSIFGKLGAGTRAEAIVRARDGGFGRG